MNASQKSDIDRVLSGYLSIEKIGPKNNRVQNANCHKQEKNKTIKHTHTHEMLDISFQIR